MSVKSCALALLGTTYSTDSEDESELGSLQSNSNSPDGHVELIGSSGVDEDSESTETVSSKDEVSPKSTCSESEDEFEKLLPPLTTAPYPAEQQGKYDYLVKQVEAGLDINQFIQSRKQYRNPSMYTKLIEHCGIEEYGTNFSPAVYDPFKWNKLSFYEELAKEQQDYMQKLLTAKPKKEVPVQVITGTVKKPSTSSIKENYNPNNSSSSNVFKRKSGNGRAH